MPNRASSLLQFFLYVLVGCAATLVHYTMLVVLVETTSLAAAPATFIGAISGAVVSFMLNHNVTFSRNNAHTQTALMRFLVTAAGGAAVSAALVWMCVQLFSWHYLVAQTLATVLLLLLTYQINRRWSFVR